MSWWHPEQPDTVSALSHTGSVDGVPWHDVAEHVRALLSYVPPIVPTKFTSRTPFTWYCVPVDTLIATLQSVTTVFTWQSEHE
jgi:hypothetical protein